METGIEIITKERQRQIEMEGYTSDHDDEYEDEELARAASVYAMPDFYRDLRFKTLLKRIKVNYLNLAMIFGRITQLEFC